MSCSKSKHDVLTIEDKQWCDWDFIYQRIYLTYAKPKVNTVFVLICIYLLPKGLITKCMHLSAIELSRQPSILGSQDDTGLILIRRLVMSVHYTTQTLTNPNHAVYVWRKSSLCLLVTCKDSMIMINNPCPLILAARQVLSSKWIKNVISSLSL